MPPFPCPTRPCFCVGAPCSLLHLASAPYVSTPPPVLSIDCHFWLRTLWHVPCQHAFAQIQFKNIAWLNFVSAPVHGFVYHFPSTVLTHPPDSCSPVCPHVIPASCPQTHCYPPTHSTLSVVSCVTDVKFSPH